MTTEEFLNLGDPIEEDIECYWHVHQDEDYAYLFKALYRAYQQAASGKGAKRHASGERFEEQPILAISRQVGIGFCLGQAVKKIYESRRLEKEAAVQELLGSIVYIAAAIILREERK